MSVVVVDTDVVSFIFRQDLLGEHYIPRLEQNQCVIPFMTLAELALWPLRARWNPERERKLLEYLEDNFAVLFADKQLCFLWAQGSGSV